MYLYSKDKKFLTYIGILCALYILPIILADFYYSDDLRRTVHNQYGWITNGRELWVLFYWFMNAFGPAFDLAPLNQILAIVCLVAASFILYKRLFYFCSPLIASFIAFLFIANPFYLQNISYRYEALMMSIAILLAVLAFNLATKSSNKNLLYSLLVLTCSLLFYQPTMAIFVGLCFLYFIYNAPANPKQYLTLLLKMALIAILSYILYDIISRPFIDGYIKGHEKIITFNLAGYHQLITNIQGALVQIEILFQDKITYLLFLCPFILSSLYTVYRAYVLLNKNKNVYSIITGLIILISPFILFFVMLLPIIPLQIPIIVSRVFMGFGTLLLFSFGGFIHLSQKLGIKKVRYFIILPVIYCIGLSFTYGNILKSQKSYEEKLINYIAEDLKSLNQIQNISKVAFNGVQPDAPENKIILNKRPFFKSILDRSLNEPLNTRWLTNIYFEHFTIFNPVDRAPDEEIFKEFHLVLEKAKKLPILKQNNIYSLKIVKDIAVIEYKNHD